MAIPKEFDIIKTGKGYTMKGWDFTAAEIADAIQNDKMLNPAYELGTNACPLNCFFCFTEDDNPEGMKKRLQGEMSLDERLALIGASAELGARSINFVGAGEPLIDPHFWTIVEHIDAKGMTPIVYTEGTAVGKKNTLTDADNAKRLYDLGATVVLKVNSLADRDWQNAIVFSGERSKALHGFDYFEQRNRALEVLIETGFNRHDPTRLAFDTIICRENYAEIPAIHRYARDNNIFVLFVGYLPSGRTTHPAQNAVSKTEQFAMFRELARIDTGEYGMEHRAIFPYAGGVPCSIRGLGLYVKIKGEAWDCPGELEPLGSMRTDTLHAIWERAKPIREAFDGGCRPRDAFWERYGDKPSTSVRRHLPIYTENH